MKTYTIRNQPGLFHKVPKWTLILILVLVVIRLALPAIGLKVINSALKDKLGKFTASIEDFDLSLYRGAYQVKQLKVVKKSDKSQPFIAAEEIDVSIAWRNIFKGHFDADVVIYDAKVSILDSKHPEKKQTGKEEKKKNWKKAARVIVPLKIESIQFYHSDFLFKNADVINGTAINISDINLEARDLITLGKKNNKQILSPAKANGTLQGHAPIHVTGGINVLAKPPVLDLDVTVDQFDVTSINKLLIHYLPLDITKGKLDLYGELVYYSGRMAGYAKLFLHDGDVISASQNYQSPKHFLVEIASSLGNSLLEKRSNNTLGVRIPFTLEHGKFATSTSDILNSATEYQEGRMHQSLEHSLNLKKALKHWDTASAKSH